MPIFKGEVTVVLKIPFEVEAETLGVACNEMEVKSLQQYGDLIGHNHNPQDRVRVTHIELGQHQP